MGLSTYLVSFTIKCGSSLGHGRSLVDLDALPATGQELADLEALILERNPGPGNTNVLVNNLVLLKGPEAPAQTAAPEVPPALLARLDKLNAQILRMTGGRPLPVRTRPAAPAGGRHWGYVDQLESRLAQAERARDQYQQQVARLADQVQRLEAAQGQGVRL